MSNAKSPLSIKRQLTAASSIASAAVGTADLTSLKALPVSCYSFSPKNCSHKKRGIPTAIVSSAAEMDEVNLLVRDRSSQRAGVGTKDQGPDPEDFRQDTTLPKCMCYCGQSFATKQDWTNMCPCS